MKRSVFTGKRFFIAFFILLPLLTSCASHQTHQTNNAPQPNKNTASFVYIQNSNATTQKKTQVYQQNGWIITANLTEKTTKPKIDFYDFTFSSSSKAFSITDINYKYGDYGKWRIIEKKKYLSHLSLGSAKISHSITVKRFPITVKKIGVPHNQLLQFTFSTNSSTTDNNSTEYINLIFGIQKCIAKSSKEFVCF